jgi:hypothetical protein
MGAFSSRCKYSEIMGKIRNVKADKVAGQFGNRVGVRKIAGRIWIIEP